MEDELFTEINTRSANKKIRVTYADGRCICYIKAIDTYLEALRSIEVERLSDINLEIGHLPLISQEIHSKYKNSMREFRRGWYVNTQSITEQKYLHLVSINMQLNLGWKVEIGEDFETQKTKGFTKRGAKESLLVKFPDGEYVGEESPIKTFVACIEKLGIDNVRRKNVPVASKELITRNKEYNSQQQLSNGQWLTIPSSTKDKAKIMKIVGIMLGVKLEVTTI